MFGERRPWVCAESAPEAAAINDRRVSIGLFLKPFFHERIGLRAIDAMRTMEFRKDRSIGDAQLRVHLFHALEFPARVGDPDARVLIPGLDQKRTRGN